MAPITNLSRGCPLRILRWVELSGPGNQGAIRVRSELLWTVTQMELRVALGSRSLCGCPKPKRRDARKSWGGSKQFHLAA
jgi:hypothetical protein